MPEDATTRPQRVLDPLERFSEILFGLIMVLTFTCSLHVARAGRGDVRTMLIGALGCNVAWGIIDAVMYLMASLSERGHGILTVRAVRQATDPKEGHRIIAAALPPVVASNMPVPWFEAIRTKLLQLPELPAQPRLEKDDWRGALGVFFLVSFSTLPPVIPFLLTSRIGLAMRVSNGIAITMLFLTGFAYGRYAGHRPWGWGLSMVFVGGAMVVISIVLGG
jgi:VIT1/CCC1 family predicted Fe2+/Mn2+ transporter